MRNICPTTAVTAVVAVAARIRMVEALRPAGRNLPEGLRSRASRLFRRLRRLIDNSVAAAIAYREQQATLSTLGKLSDAELRDFGVYRGSPASPFHRYRGVKSATKR